MGAQRPSLDQTDMDQAWWWLLEVPPCISRGSMTWQARCGIDRCGMWAHGPPAMSHCLLCTSFVHFCNFSYIQINFSSTSGTRWILTKYGTCDVVLPWFGWNVDGQIGCLVTINKLPQATPLLVLGKDAGLACWIRNCFNVTPCKTSYTNQYYLLSWAR